MRFLTSRQGISRVDIFDALRDLSKNSVGREIAWNYFRINYNDLVNTYGYDDPRLGQALLDIAFSFESRFLFNEVSFLSKFWLHYRILLIYHLSKAIGICKKHSTRRNRDILSLFGIGENIQYFSMVHNSSTANNRFF